MTRKRCEPSINTNNTNTTRAPLRIQITQERHEPLQIQITQKQHESLQIVLFVFDTSPYNLYITKTTRVICTQQGLVSLQMLFVFVKT